MQARSPLALGASSCTLILLGCAPYRLPPPPTPRDATVVEASFGGTWDAVIDEFADRNIPIQTIERASGLIATTQLNVSYDAREDADCGSYLTKYAPTHVIYNVVVRGDSTKSTVKVTMRWLHVTTKTSRECTTTHRYERTLEGRVHDRALQHEAEHHAALPNDAPVHAVQRASVGSSGPPTRAASVTLTCDDLPTGPLDNPEDERRRLYVGDLRRAGLVECVEQILPDLVRIMVAPSFKALSAEDRDAKFARLLGAYGSWGRVFVELWTPAGKFAEYADGQYRTSTIPRPN